MFSLVVGLALVVGCTQSVAEVPKQEPETGVREIRVQGGDFWLEPTSISINKGDTVKIIFENVGSITHNLAIDGFGRTETISGGSTDTLEFVADRAGTFDMWCAVEGHRAAGMEGSLVVE